MFARKTLLIAAALAGLTAGGIGVAQAQPRQAAVHVTVHRGPVVVHRTVVRPAHRPYVARARIYETLRLRHYAGIGEPYFLHGRYVIRSHDRRGRVVMVQIDPYTGRYIGVVRM